MFQAHGPGIRALPDACGEHFTTRRSRRTQNILQTIPNQSSCSKDIGTLRLGKRVHMAFRYEAMDDFINSLERDYGTRLRMVWIGLTQTCQEIRCLLQAEEKNPICSILMVMSYCWLVVLSCTHFASLHSQFTLDRDYVMTCKIARAVILAVLLMFLGPRNWCWWFACRQVERPFSWRLYGRAWSS